MKSLTFFSAVILSAALMESGNCQDESAAAGSAVSTEERESAGAKAPSAAAEEPDDAPDSDGTTGEEEAAKAAMEALVSSLDFKKGEQVIGGGAITLNLPEGFSFLAPADARRILVDLWGNPPAVGKDIAGLIVPRGVDLRTAESWVAVVNFEKTGYVEDKDASGIDYDDMLKTMKSATIAGNLERKQQGFGTIKLVGWALPPAYDATARVLHWAKELDFQGSPEHTLNYDVRVLGRRGVVSLNCVAGISQLKEVKALAPEMAGLATFNEGHRYADFDASKDEKAEYGLAGLVIGGAVAAKVAAKVGIFKGLMLALVAGKKFVIIGVIALGALVKKFLAGRSAR